MSTHFKDQQKVKLNWSTYVDLLVDRAGERPDQKVYTFLHRGETEADTLTYRELDRQARAIATVLQSCKARGERALLLYPPGLDFITAFLGCLYAGVVAVPAYPPRPNQKLTRLQAIVADARPQVILTTSSLLERIERRFTLDTGMEVDHWLATDNINNELASDWQKPAIDGNTLAFLQYTSGSTGNPT
jgi:acyl-CoA synthetase (AMP-forming)/AMP-acid ligase II